MSTDPSDDALAERVRRLFAEEADSMSIDPGGLDEIRSRTAQRGPRWGWGPTIAGVAAAAAVVVGVVVWTGQRGGGDVVGTVAESPSPAVSATASPGPATATASPTPTTAAEPTGGTGQPASTPPATVRLVVPVYYVQDTPRGLRLDREFHQVRATGAAEGALAEMLAGRSQDPSSTSSWDPATTVRSVTRAGGRITVDLSRHAATADVGSEAAELAVQQLVYTVTAALQADLPVQLLVAGKPVELWGHVSTQRPIRRADPLSVRKLVQINDPAYGATTTRTVTVRGEAAVFEATLPWELRGADGAVVQSGTATTAEGQRFAPFSFRLPRLAPGTYTIVVSEDDPSGGEAGPVMTEEHRFTVR
jgi:hypothetical protein